MTPEEAVALTEMLRKDRQPPESVPCPDCGGTGVDEVHGSRVDWWTCPRCDGRGKVQ